MTAQAALSTCWTRLPLPAEHAVGIIAGLLLQRHAGRRRLPAAAAPVGWPLVAAGVALNGWAVAARGGDAIEHPALLVTGGPQARTRNPMYVGMTVAYVGGSLLLGTWWAPAVLPAIVAVIDRKVIRREEAYLRSRFGKQYDEFCRHTRRWV